MSKKADEALNKILTFADEAEENQEQEAVEGVDYYCSKYKQYWYRDNLQPYSNCLEVLGVVPLTNGIKMVAFRQKTDQNADDIGDVKFLPIGEFLMEFSTIINGAKDNGNG